MEAGWHGCSLAYVQSGVKQVMGFPYGDITVVVQCFKKFLLPQRS